LKTNPISQHGAAVALVQLLTEHPTLLPLDWHISRHGFFAGALQGDALLQEDARPVVAAWHAVLGGTVQENDVVFNREARRAFHLKARWRDVLVELHVSCPVSALVESAVAA
jgi:hypothetical protein